MLVATRQKRPNLTLKCPPVSIESQTFTEVDNHKVLGVTTDSNLSWSSHMTALCQSTSKKMYQLSKIEHFRNLDARKVFFHVHIQPTINYRSMLWDSASANALKPMFGLHLRECSRQFSSKPQLEQCQTIISYQYFPSKKDLAIGLNSFY